MSATTKKWLSLYARGGFLEPVKCAIEVGCKAPEAAAERMARRCSKIISRWKLERWVAESMTVEECRRFLSEIGRGNVPATPQQVKALEMIARFHGLLTDKVDINLEQSDLERAMARAIEGHLERTPGLQTQLPPPPLRLPEPVG